MHTLHRCNECSDYVLCNECVGSKAETKEHKHWHPMHFVTAELGKCALMGSVSIHVTLPSSPFLCRLLLRTEPYLMVLHYCEQTKFKVARRVYTNMTFDAAWGGKDKSLKYVVRFLVDGRKDIVSFTFASADVEMTEEERTLGLRHNFFFGCFISLIAYFPFILHVLCSTN